MKHSRLGLLVLAALPVAHALADARIRYETSEGDGTTIESTMIGHGKVRTDADETTSVILDPGARTMLVLNHDKREYTRLGEAELEQMGEALKVAMAGMEQAMAAMTPEMREQMQGMIGGAIPGMDGAGGIKVVDTGRQDRVGGHSCTVFRTELQGKVVNESCMGSASALDGLSAADRATLEAALAMTADLVETLSQGPLQQYLDLSPFKGGLVPLRTTDLQDGRRHSSEFAGVDDATLAPALFAVPAGYREQKLEMPDLSGR